MIRILIGLIPLLLLACTPLSVPAASRDEQPPPPPASLILDEADVSPTTPRVTLQRKVWLQPYTVSGDSASEIRGYLDRHGPYSDLDGRAYDAQTVWSLELFPRSQSAGDGCRFGGATIVLNDVIELPELVSTEGLIAAEAERWTEYREALEQHEMGHAERHNEVALSLRESLLALDPAASCAELQKSVAALKQVAIEAMRAADVEYDRATEHGARQGAVFP